MIPPSSLIICSRNRPDFLIETVQSVLAGDHLPDEIIVVDHSDKQSTELAGAGVQNGCEIRYLPPRATRLLRRRHVGSAELVRGARSGTRRGWATDRRGGPSRRGSARSK